MATVSLEHSKHAVTDCMKRADDDGPDCREQGKQR